MPRPPAPAKPPVKTAPARTGPAAAAKTLPFPTSESIQNARPAAKTAAVKTPAVKTVPAKSAPAKPPRHEDASATVAAEPLHKPGDNDINVYPFHSQHKPLRKLWQQWQPGQPQDSRDARGAKPSAIDLTAFDPSAKPFSLDKGKQQDKDAVFKLATELDALQNVFYADRRFKLLVILQGMDAAGKDGTLRGVFSQMTPLGVRTVGWKAPTETEKARDYLWRLHLQTPASGEIVVFNRSQYEDVLVPVVNQWITPEQQAQRYAQINDFERMLSETGTVIVKFMLHISKDEQRQRLQERLDDPCKHWKFDEGDLKVRAQWNEYQQAYAQLLAATHTPWAPWTIVPADSKTHRNLMIATVLREVLGNLDLKYPPGAPALEKIKVK
jgi:PPK2 family polyphosphate:nucleotide phosphotransferase